MKTRAMKKIEAALHAHTERRSLAEMAREGKRHISVLSRQRIVEMIQAIVDDAISSEANTLARKDRDEIVAAAEKKLTQVGRLQAEAETELRRQQASIEQYEEQVADMAARQAVLEARIAELTSTDEQIEEQLRRERILHAETHESVREAEKREHQTRRDLERLKERLITARDTIEEDDREISRLVGQVKQDEDLLREMQERLRSKESEAREADRRLHELSGELKATKSIDPVSELKVELNELRAAMRSDRVSELELELDDVRAAMRHDDSVGELKQELAGLKSAIQALGDRPAEPDHTAVDRLAEQLGRWEERAASDLEDRFHASLDRTLDEINRTVRSATARPIENRVEATDALIAEIFDDEPAMESNSGSLSVEQRSSSSGIDKSLDRLRAMRQGPAASRD